MADNAERLAKSLAGASGVDRAAVEKVLASLAAAGMTIIASPTGKQWCTGWNVATSGRRPVEDAFVRLAHV